VTAKSVPTGAEWLHEVKSDGYRVWARALLSTVAMGTISLTVFAFIAQLLHELPAKAAVLDGARASNQRSVAAYLVPQSAS